MIGVSAHRQAGKKLEGVTVEDPYGALTRRDGSPAASVGNENLVEVPEAENTLWLNLSRNVSSLLAASLLGRTPVSGRTSNPFDLETCSGLMVLLRLGLIDQDFCVAASI